MAHNPVGWFEIYVNDMDRAKRFYETVFDIKIDGAVAIRRQLTRNVRLPNGR